jgi:hypothetical protein
LLAGQRNLDAYIALCAETELRSGDCKTLAAICQSRKCPGEALAWVERGLKMAQADSRSSYDGHELMEMKRSLLAQLGRTAEALQSAWTEYESHPSTFTYQELMRYVPSREKMAWRQKAMEASEKGDLASQIELWSANKENARLVARLRRATNEELESLSHYHAEPLTRKLERSHPDVSAKVYRALSVRIVNAGKSKYYKEALDYIAKAKKCYAKAGLNAAWKAEVAGVRELHFRKKGFMAGFEKIVSGAPRHVRPLFLTRAKARWLGKSGRR